MKSGEGGEEDAEVNGDEEEQRRQQRIQNRKRLRSSKRLQKRAVPIQGERVTHL